MTSNRKKSVWLVQQGVWDMPKESMPLGIGYLRAAAWADERIRNETDIRIFNFNGGDTVISMGQTMFGQGCPDVLGFSVWGWNYTAFGHLAETYKQLNPGGWVVFGGTHVANQAERVFRQYPHVDVIVNTEGEFVFRDLLRAHLAGTALTDLAGIGGISFRAEDRSLVTTESPPRIQDLESIPSPFLTGAIPLTDDRGEFRYDVALMESNRGCPYSCAFCYWGGAIGQKVRAFSRERLRAELEIFGYHKVHAIVLCDANFGMLPGDVEFVEDVIRTRERFGFPRSIDTSWAKNKSKVFYDIVRRMKRAGLQSSFTLALQTLNESALEMMKRRNMRLNDWEELVAWLREEGMDCYAELIWGAPGETTETFLEGYDRLAKYMTRIATYQLLLLPNTEYSKGKDKFGLVTVRGDRDDFEYVLATNTVKLEEHIAMQPFLLWARSLAEHLVLRHIWAPLRLLAGQTQSSAIRSFRAWIDQSQHPTALELAALSKRLSMQPSSLPTFLYQLIADPTVDDLLRDWWRESILPLIPAEHVDLLSEVFRYDILTRAVYMEPGSDETLPAGLHEMEIDGVSYYCRPDVHFDYDIPEAVQRYTAGEAWVPERQPVTVSLYYKTGYCNHYANHEQAVTFPGRTFEELGSQESSLVVGSSVSATPS
jgi:tRNA A37 methylthiotransferase MiaB